MFRAGHLNYGFLSEKKKGHSRQRKECGNIIIGRNMTLSWVKNLLSEHESFVPLLSDGNYSWTGVLSLRSRRT